MESIVEVLGGGGTGTSSFKSKEVFVSRRDGGGKNNSSFSVLLSIMVWLNLLSSSNETKLDIAEICRAVETSKKDVSLIKQFYETCGVVARARVRVPLK